LLLFLYSFFFFGCEKIAIFSISQS
jgi:hypothetical protein